MTTTELSVFVRDFFNLAPIAVAFLQPLRNVMSSYNEDGKTVFYSMIINSGIRAPKYNSSLKNAAKDSNHLRGLAVDIAYPSCTSLIKPLHKFIRLLLTSMVSSGMIKTYEVIPYESFIHVSF